MSVTLDASKCRDCASSRCEHGSPRFFKASSCDSVRSNSMATAVTCRFMICTTPIRRCSTSRATLLIAPRAGHRRLLCYGQWLSEPMIGSFICMLPRFRRGSTGCCNGWPHGPTDAGDGSWSCGSWRSSRSSVVGSSVGATFSQGFHLSGTESQRATDLLQSRFPAQAGDEGQIVFASADGVGAPAVQHRMEALFAEVARVPRRDRGGEPVHGRGLPSGRA